MRRLISYSLVLLLALTSVASASAVASKRGGDLQPCPDERSILCGSISRPLDPSDPSAGSIEIGFKLWPARSGVAEGTIVAVEGGPGYASTASADWYLDLYEPLRDSRDLLIVDNRGTGLSEPIACRQLQSYEGDYVEAVAECGEQLGSTSDVYGSALAADDMAAVLDSLGIAEIDLYGDSYGTFFAQTFAVRHPTRVRTVTLDAAYPVEGLDPWYRDIGRAMVDAFQSVCARDLQCAAEGGDPIDRLRALADALAVAPLSGRARDADGVPRRVTVDVPGLIFLMGSATYGHTVYRELDAAGQAWLENGDPAPLLRIMAEQTWWGSAGPLAEYSEGLYVAVACNDYPQLWDIFAPLPSKEAQLQAAIDAIRVSDPSGFYPFSVDEWIAADWVGATFCVPWPAPDPWVPPLPEPHTYPDVPVLVMVGDLDSITPPEASQQVAAHFPNSTYVEVANVGHVVALGDYHGCASEIAINFVVTGGDTGDTGCATSTYQEVRTVESFPRVLAEVAPVEGVSQKAGQVARAVADTVGDIFPRWMNMFGEAGVGLRGGTFTSTGLDIVRFDLDRLSYMSDLAVSGMVMWNRFTGEVTATVTFEGASTGRLVLEWNDYDRHAVATVTGQVEREAVSLTLPAP